MNGQVFKAVPFPKKESLDRTASTSIRVSEATGFTATLTRENIWVVAKNPERRILT